MTFPEGVRPERDGISALDYAAGDGTTDDTVALQAAFTRAGVLRADVFIPATGAFYKLTDEITVPDGVRVYGGGRLKQTVVNKNCLVLGDDTSVTGLRIEGPSLLSTADIKNTGIEINGVRRVEVRSCDISGFETGGILLRNCHDVLLDGNYLHGNDWLGSRPGAGGGDIYSYSSTVSGRIVITNNFCMSNSSQGIGVAVNGHEQDVIVTANVCITLDATGAVRGTETLKRRHGIMVGYASLTFPERRVVCANNIIGNTQWSGIYAQCSGSENTGPLSIHDNMIFDVGYTTTTDLSAGVYVAARGEVPVSVRNNTVLRFRNTNDTAGAFVALSGGGGTTGVVVFENNKSYGSLGNGMFLGGLIAQVTVNGHTSINTARKDMILLANPGHTASKDFVFSGLDVRRNNALDVPIVLLPDAGTKSRIILKNFRLVGHDKTVAAAANAAVHVKVPTLTDIHDGEIENFYYATDEVAYAAPNTRYFNEFTRDRITVRNCINGLGFGGLDNSTTWIAEGCRFIGVTNKFHGSSIGAVVVGREGRRNGDNLELFGNDRTPNAGTSAVGDRAPNRVPRIGRPKAWVVTSAGSPGTWTSEGNL